MRDAENLTRFYCESCLLNYVHGIWPALEFGVYLTDITSLEQVIIFWTVKEFPRYADHVRYGLEYDMIRDDTFIWKKHFEQYHVNYKGVNKLNKGYINYTYITFSDLELSILSKLRYLTAVFCKMWLKGCPFGFLKCYLNCYVTWFPWKQTV